MKKLLHAFLFCRVYIDKKNFAPTGINGFHTKSYLTPEHACIYKQQNAYFDILREINLVYNFKKIMGMIDFSDQL